MTGIHMETHSARPAGKYVHIQGGAWAITSNTPPETMVDDDVPLFASRLPGRMGEYILPADAVFCVAQDRATRAEDLASAMQCEAGTAVDEQVALTHFSVCGPPSAPAEPEDDEEDDECQSEHDDDDEMADECEPDEFLEGE